MKHGWLLLLALMFLTSCVLSPEERRARELARIKEQRQIQIVLTAQCDSAVADLMRASDLARDAGDTDEWRRLQEQYLLRAENPLFRNCFAVAEENLKNKQRAQDAEWWADYWERRKFRGPMFPPLPRLPPMRPLPPPPPPPKLQR